MSGELDFAFVDSFSLDKSIKTEPVYDEVLELCISKKMPLPQKPQAEIGFFQKLSYVDYQEEQSVLSLWMRHHLQVRNPELDVRVYITDAQAVSKLILNQVGAGILPGHLAQKLLNRGEDLIILKGTSTPLVNTISIAHLEDKTLTLAGKAVLDHLRAQLKR